jgi:hypothetical protein
MVQVSEQFTSRGLQYLRSQAVAVLSGRSAGTIYGLEKKISRALEEQSSFKQFFQFSAASALDLTYREARFSEALLSSDDFARAQPDDIARAR